MIHPWLLTASLVLLAVALTVAVLRPRGWPEAVGAVPAAAAALGLGLLSVGQARAEVIALGPTVGFLAAVLVLAWLCQRDGLFDAVGDRIAAASGGRPVVLLALVFLTCSTVTAALSLDTTVVLLTPVIYATVSRLRVRPGPHLYACVHLSNSASLLAPVSNLTNLLAFSASGLSFLRFTALMAGPWLAAIGVEWVVLRRFFAADLHDRGAPTGDPRPLPTYTVAVVAATLAGFALTSLIGLDLWVAATAGALGLAVPALRRRRATLSEVARAGNAPFLLFVFALAITVKAVQVNGLNAVGAHVPTGTSLAALLAVAAVAAVLANLINNLPAILVLLPALAGHPGPVLAAVIGVNIGPNLTYAGSLATLLWRRILNQHGEHPSISRFTRLGILTVPLGVAAATTTLWAALHLIGTG